MDRAPEQIHPVQVATGPGDQVDGPVLVGVRRADVGEELRVRRVGRAVRPLGEIPDAAAVVVGEKQRAVVLGGVGRTRSGRLVERQPRHRGGELAVDRSAAPVVGGDPRRMVVREVRLGRLAAAEGVAQGRVRAPIGPVLVVALVTRPTEVRRGGPRDVGDAIDLLVVVPTDVAEPEFVGAGPERESERIAQAVGDDASFVRVGTSAEGVAGCGSSRRRVDPDERAVQGRGGGSGRRGAGGLGAERAALTVPCIAGVAAELTVIDERLDPMKVLATMCTLLGVGLLRVNR